MADWDLFHDPKRLNAFIAKRNAAMAEEMATWPEVIPQWSRNGITYTYDPVEGREVYVSGVEADV